jgi:hypothetical protein
VSTSQPESGVECDATVPIISERLSDGSLVNNLNFVVLQLASEVIEQDCWLPLLDNFRTFRDIVVGSAFGHKAEVGFRARQRPLMGAMRPFTLKAGCVIITRCERQ